MSGAGGAGGTADAGGVVAIAGTLEPYLGPLTGLVVDAAIFLAVIVATYVLYKVLIGPLLRRVFDRQGLDEHARRPLQKIVAFLVLFAGVTVAFTWMIIAGYNVLRREDGSPRVAT